MVILAILLLRHSKQSSLSHWTFTAYSMQRWCQTPKPRHIPVLYPLPPSLWNTNYYCKHSLFKNVYRFVCVCVRVCFCCRLPCLLTYKYLWCDKTRYFCILYQQTKYANGPFSWKLLPYLWGNKFNINDLHATLAPSKCPENGSIWSSAYQAFCR